MILPTEDRIQNALPQIMANRTTILVAHRLSTAQKANRILVIKKGEILQDGSHQDLMAQKGMYLDMVNLEKINNL